MVSVRAPEIEPAKGETRVDGLEATVGLRELERKGRRN